MMPAVGTFDIVMGCDIHLILVPAAPAPIPTLLPHLYFGMVLDVTDWIPSMGGSVRVNQMACARSSSSTINIPCHIPSGGMWGKPPFPSNNGDILTGSSVVKAANQNMAFMGIPVTSCDDIGNMPTSFLLPIPKGFPVLVNMTPDIATAAGNMAFAAVSSAALGSSKAKSLLAKIPFADKIGKDSIEDIAKFIVTKGLKATDRKDWTDTGKWTLKAVELVAPEVEIVVGVQQDIADKSVKAVEDLI
jgi:uncharacterized Zn-binding protein involved in type VI secretion